MDNDFDIEGISVLPIQFLDRSFQGAELQPEKRLQLAVLADAATTYVRSALSTAETERAVFGELEEWFASDTAAGPFSFDTCRWSAHAPGRVTGGKDGSCSTVWV